VARTERLPRLMLITDRHRTRGRDMVPLLAQAVVGGVGLVQVREKDLPEEELLELVQRVTAAIGDAARIVVNRSLRVARACGAGLHLPAAEVDPWPANGRPADLLVGRSVHDEREADRALESQVDYLILGPIYATPSKPGHPGHGLDLVRRISEQVRPVPLYAVGGVTVSRVPELIHSGARGVAVSGELLSAGDPARVAQAMALGLHVCPPEAG